ncbi:MAG: hypothetical protein Q8747_02475 [Candidatus Phytoplasma australasiaticum]|nr:hypothetical protein [Candidatus Phytoplasma australasiaticum]
MDPPLTVVEDTIDEKPVVWLKKTNDGDDIISKERGKCPVIEKEIR